jgi:hypothetical protein
MSGLEFKPLMLRNTNVTIEEVTGFPTWLVRWLKNPNKRLTMTNSTNINNSLDVIDLTIDEKPTLTYPYSHQLSIKRIRLCFHRKPSYYCKSCKKIKREKLKGVKVYRCRRN